MEALRSTFGLPGGLSGLPCYALGESRSLVRSTKDMRKRSTYTEYLESRRRQSVRAIPVILRDVGITVEESGLALLSLALLVLLLIVLLIGG